MISGAHELVELLITTMAQPNLEQYTGLTPLELCIYEVMANTGALLQINGQDSRGLCRQRRENSLATLLAYDMNSRYVYQGNGQISFCETS